MKNVTVVLICLVGFTRLAAAACDLHISPPFGTILDSGKVGQSYSNSKTIGASGGTPPYAFSNPGGFGALPPGLSINAATGVISGTPTKAGTYNEIEIDVIDSGGCEDSAIYEIVVNPGNCAMAIVPKDATLVAGAVGVAYSFDFGESGGTQPVTFTASFLPPGLSVSAAGLLSGKPTAAGTFSFHVTVVDANGCTDEGTYGLTITGSSNCSVSLSEDGLTSVRKGAGYFANATVENTGTTDCSGTLEFDFGANVPNSIVLAGFPEGSTFPVTCSGNATSQKCTGTGTLKPNKTARAYVIILANQNPILVPWTIKWNDSVKQGLQTAMVLPARSAQRISQPPPRETTWTIWK